MNSQESKSLILGLQNSGDKVPEPIKKDIIQQAKNKNKEILNEFISLLFRGDDRTRVKLVDIISEVQTPQVFDLLYYALHDPYESVRSCVIKNLKKFDYYLPFINNLLNENTELDLEVRGELLGVLFEFNMLDGIENWLDAMRYGNVNLKLLSIEKLDSIINDETRKKIRFEMADALKHEYHSDIRSALIKAITPTKKEDTNLLDILKSSKDWFSVAVLYFRELGFFSDYFELTDSELIDKLKTLRSYDPADTFTHNTNLLEILEEDKKRIWKHDPKLYWEDTDNPYEAVIREWGEISCNELTPENINIIHDEANEKLHINFVNKGKSIEIITYDYQTIWLPILEDINNILAGSEIQFCNIVTDTDQACIACLTALQKASLEKDLRLHFELMGRYLSPPKLY